MAKSDPLKKVLIIRFSSLGDVVLTSLAVRCLKKQKQCQIHYLTKTSFGSLVKDNPYIDKVWTIGDDLNAVLPLLKAEQFDLILDLHNNLRSRRVRLSLWKVPVVSYNKANLAKWLAVYVKLFRFPREHIALRYLQALKKFEVSDDGDGLDFFIPSADRIDPLERFGVSGPYIALVLGAAHFTKRVPVLKWKEFLALLNPGQDVILIGGKNEQDLGNELSGAHIHNACGLLSINQSASLLQQAKAVVAPDTGMMHIAAALKKPIRSIWGSTLPEFGFWPFYGFKHQDLNQSFEIKGLYCRPCSRFGREACPQGHFRCMMEQDMKSIAQSV